MRRISLIGSLLATVLLLAACSEDEMGADSTLGPSCERHLYYKQSIEPALSDMSSAIGDVVSIDTLSINTLSWMDSIDSFRAVLRDAPRGSAGLSGLRRFADISEEILMLMERDYKARLKDGASVERKRAFDREWDRLTAELNGVVETAQRALDKQAGACRRELLEE